MVSVRLCMCAVACEVCVQVCEYVCELYAHPVYYYNAIKDIQIFVVCGVGVRRVCGVFV